MTDKHRKEISDKEKAGFEVRGKPKWLSPVAADQGHEEASGPSSELSEEGTCWDGEGREKVHEGGAPIQPLTCPSRSARNIKLSEA